MREPVGGRKETVSWRITPFKGPPPPRFVLFSLFWKVRPKLPALWLDTGGARRTLGPWFNLDPGLAGWWTIASSDWLSPYPESLIFLGGLSNSGVWIAHAWVASVALGYVPGSTAALGLLARSRQETDGSGHTREHPGSRNSVTASPRVQKSVPGVLFVPQVYFAITRASKYNMSRCLLK